jgi:hypothetical protein
LIPCLISVLALGTAILLYVQNPPRVLPRALALLLLFLLATSAAFRFGVRKKTGPPAVLIDASPSMARYLPDATERADGLPFRHQTFFIKDQRLFPEPVESPGSYTDLTAGLQRIAAARPSAVILITDGNHNYGPDPLSRAEDWNFPVYPVGVGPESLKDQAVTEVRYPAYVFRADSTVVTAIIESRGFTQAETGRAILESADQKIRLSRDFILSDAPGKRELTFPVVLRETGMIGFRISIPARNHETDRDNNAYDFTLEVLPDKIKVLYYTDHLSFNTRFLVPILKALPGFELHAVVRLCPDRTIDFFTGIEPRDPGDWHSFDIWIMDDVDFRSLSGRDLPGFLNRKRGVLFLGGIDNLTDEGRRLLPIPVRGRLPAGSYPFQVAEPFSELTPAEKYPPLEAVSQVIGNNPGAVIIVRSAKIPVMGYAPYGPGLVFQINALDIGAWQFSLNGTKHEGLLTKLVPDIVRFLSILGERKRLVLTAPGSDAEAGRALRLTLQSFDRDLRPAGGGDFFLSAGGEKIPFFETRPHFYEAEFIPRAEGDYELTAAGLLNADSLRSRTLKIRVKPRQGESEKVIDRSRLENLAERTGGRYLEKSDLSGLRLPAEGYYRETRKISFDHPLVYFMIFILLCADWILRRRRGTL